MKTPTSTRTGAVATTGTSVKSGERKRNAERGARRQPREPRPAPFLDAGSRFDVGRGRRRSQKAAPGPSRRRWPEATAEPAGNPLFVHKIPRLADPDHGPQTVEEAGEEKDEDDRPVADFERAYEVDPEKQAENPAGPTTPSRRRASPARRSGRRRPPRRGRSSRREASWRESPG